MPPAGRPREFDPNVALDAAVDAFWANGFQGTSMSDLEAATGLKKGSLYKAFGDKHSLFMKVLERYMDEQIRPHAPRFFEAPTATEGLRSFVEWAQARGTCNDGSNRGCLAVNSVNELSQGDPIVRQALQDAHGQLVGLLTGLIRRGQETGEFRSDVDAESLADYVMMINAGFVIREKGEFGTPGTTDLTEIALSAILAR